MLSTLHKSLLVVSHNSLAMEVLKFAFMLILPVLTFGQNNYTFTTTNFKIYDLSDSRFDIDSNGFHGEADPDTTYYTNGKIASIYFYAISKNHKMSGMQRLRTFYNRVFGNPTPLIFRDIQDFA
jgi:hypothetical protein